MTRNDFHKLFKATGPVVLPVIHVLDTPRTVENVRILVGEGAAGCFLINHDFGVPQFEPIIRGVREAFPSLWMAVNFLAVTGRDAFPVLGNLQADGCQVDGYWADDARIAERPNSSAKPMSSTRRARHRAGKASISAAPRSRSSARSTRQLSAGRSQGLCAHMDVITTSGVATGHEADLSKIEAFAPALATGRWRLPRASHRTTHTLTPMLTASWWPPASITRAISTTLIPPG
jgi:hypothetical protein